MNHLWSAVEAVEMKNSRWAFEPGYLFLLYRIVSEMKLKVQFPFASVLERHKVEGRRAITML